MSEFERMSFEQCVRVLGKRTIALLTYSALNLDQYYAIAKEHGAELQRLTFPRRFFTSVRRYNELLLSQALYKRLQEWDFFLLYQLDAFVFDDDLDHWMRAGFDYVGAPFISLFNRLGTPQRPWGVGNGGLSLRRVQTFLDLYTKKGKVFSFIDFYRNCTPRHGYWYTLAKKIALTPSYIFSYFFKNSLKNYIEESRVNEDIFWCFAFKQAILAAYIGNERTRALFKSTSRLKHDITIRLPSPDQALRFAFDEEPFRCYEFAERVLPMGCHAFEKQKDFWRAYIPLP